MFGQPVVMQPLKRLAAFFIHASSDSAGRTRADYRRSALFGTQRLDNEITGPACGLFNAVLIEKTSSRIGKPFALSCRAAVSLALWERHVLAPAAQKHSARTSRRWSTSVVIPVATFTGVRMRREVSRSVPSMPLGGAHIGIPESRRRLDLLNHIDPGARGVDHPEASLTPRLVAQLVRDTRA